jgi:amino acid adenylation domain-containing protein
MSQGYSTTQLPHVSQQACIPHLLESRATSSPDAVAIIAPGRDPLTYDHLRQHIDYTIQTLNATGLGRQDRIAVVLSNGPEMAVACLAVSAAAACAPLNPEYSAREFNLYLTALHPKALIVQQGMDSPVRDVARALGVRIIELWCSPETKAGCFGLSGEKPDVSLAPASALPNDVALLMHTSGTTSRPKIVPLTHRNICTAAHHLGAALALVESDRCLNMLPLFHVFGLVSTLLVSLTASASTVCLPSFFATRFFAWLAEFCPTWYPGVPAMHQAILARAVQNRETIARYPLRFIRSGSAPLLPSVRDELESVFNTRVFEGYGMTETSGGITSHPSPLQQRKTGSVGVAVGAKIAIMDEMGTLLKAGETGEVVVRGTSVFQGYDNDPVTNKSAFTHGWFRTGDQGYVDVEGFLFVTGRLNEQTLNRGGERISLREIDDTLMTHPEVTQAVSFAVPHPRLGEEIAAAVVLHRDAMTTASDVREFVTKHLAFFKVPRQIYIVDEIPHGPTGKQSRLDVAEKLGLMEPKPTQPTWQADFTEPHTSQEKRLAAFWAQVLEVEHVGLHDDFFQLGGDSILATQLLSRVHEAFDVGLPFSSFFETPTVAGMVRAIETAKQVVSEISAPRLQPMPRDRNLPLSFAQQRLWFLEQLGVTGHAYNLPHVMHLQGELHVTALVSSLREITRRHEILRTRLDHVDGQPCQVIEPIRPISLQIVRLQDLSPDERQTQVYRLIHVEAQRPFDLTEGPLLRATLLVLGPKEHMVLFTLHHMVFDGWSLEIFWRELSALYASFCTGKPVALPDLPIQYVDFALWQRQWLRGAVLEAQLTYWRQQLCGVLPALTLPTDRPRPPRQTFQGARHAIELSSAHTATLKELCRQEGVTLFMMVLAAFQTLLYRYTGQVDQLIGVPIAGRTEVGTENLIGLFSNTLVIRTHMEEKAQFRDILRRIRTVTLEAYAHQDLPFEQLVETLQPRRDLSCHPLFQVMFVFQNMPQSARELHGLHVSPVPIDHGVALFDLTLFMRETAQGLHGMFEYRTDLFDPATIVRMGGHLKTILEAISTNHERRLIDLPLLTAAEQQQILVAWNDTLTPSSHILCLHQMFEAQVEQTPDATAVMCANQQLTYRELNRRANGLASYLCRLGVCPEVKVGICVTHSLDMLLGLLGILKAGGAYVPLDPLYPQERLAFMLADAQVQIVVTQQRFIDRLPRSRVQVVCLDTDWKDVAPRRNDNLTSGVTTANLAYVMYTSGSTGIPKGVMVPHQGLGNYLTWCTKTYAVFEGCGALVHSPIGFDATITSLFTPLLVGKQVVFAPEAAEVERLSAALSAQRRFSFLKLTPTHLELLGRQVPPREVESSTGMLILGGEALSGKSLASWRTAAPHIRLINEYGPTEAVVGCCVHELSTPTSLTGSVPIGRPIANTQIYILDRHLQPVPAGIPGELHIGGAGLARGYLNHPEWTAGQFIPHPFSNKPGARLYKSGDRARYLPDGTIEFLGRLDHQIKIRGFRIEPGEIETVLRHAPHVQEVVVIAREDYPADKRLVAYVVARQARRLDLGNLRHFLKGKLPSHLIPSTFVVLDTLPVTFNGKVDREALPALDQSRPELTAAFIAPRTQVERTLAAVWQEVLRVEKVGIHDNFFDLGGHSLLMVRLHAKLRRMLKQNVSLIDMFAYPTISSLAAYIRQQRAPASVQPSQARAARRRASIPRRKPFQDGFTR